MSVGLYELEGLYVLKEMICFWLSAKDVTKMDSAICNKTLRPYFLEHLKIKIPCIYSKEKNCYMHSPFRTACFTFKNDYFEEINLLRKQSFNLLKWLSSRSVLLTSLTFRKVNVASPNIFSVVQQLNVTEIIHFAMIESDFEYYGLENIDNDDQILEQLLPERQKHLSLFINKCLNLKSVYFKKSFTFNQDVINNISTQILDQITHIYIDTFAFNTCERIIQCISSACPSLIVFQVKRESDPLEFDDDFLSGSTISSLITSKMQCMICDLNSVITSGLVLSLFSKYCPFLNYIKLIGVWEDEFNFELIGLLLASYTGKVVNILIDTQFITVLYATTKLNDGHKGNLVLRGNSLIKFNSSMYENFFIKLFRSAQHMFCKVTLWGFSRISEMVFNAIHSNEIPLNNLEFVDCSFTPQLQNILRLNRSLAIISLQRDRLPRYFCTSAAKWHALEQHFHRHDDLLTFYY
jgi:hypothetical protein